MDIYKAKMKDLDQKLDKIVENISQINITLGKQSVILDEHVKRTNLLEKKVEPIEKHVHMIQGALKLFGMLAIFLTIYEGLMRMIGR
jgi:chromosome segregation ATPase